MSHHTTVVVNNTNIYIKSVNKVRQEDGLGPLNPGTSVSAATKAMKTQLVGNVLTEFTKQFEGTTPEGPDFGFLQPASGLSAGTAPESVVNQINLDLQNWQLPGTTDTARQMADTITEELSARGGLLGTMYGSLSVNSNENIQWVVGFAIVNIALDVEGYVYAFAAGLSF